MSTAEKRQQQQFIHIKGGDRGKGGDAIGQGSVGGKGGRGSSIIFVKGDGPESRVQIKVPPGRSTFVHVTSRESRVQTPQQST
jgi:hypothetical protein